SGRGRGSASGGGLSPLKTPPPLVPSCLMAICEAAGPTAITCSVSFDFLVVGWPFASRTGLPSLSTIGSSYSVGLGTVAVGDGFVRGDSPPLTGAWGPPRGRRREE